MNNTIRVSARIGYLKIMDLFIATSIDYNPKLEEAYTFFKIVQNKLLCHKWTYCYKYDAVVTKN